MSGRFADLPAQPRPDREVWAGDIRGIAREFHGLAAMGFLTARAALMQDRNEKKMAIERARVRGQRWGSAIKVTDPPDYAS